MVPAARSCPVVGAAGLFPLPVHHQNDPVALIPPLSENSTQIVAEHFPDRGSQAVILDITPLLLVVCFVAARLAPTGAIRCDYACDMPRLSLQFNP